MIERRKMLDCSAILRDAHSQARLIMAHEAKLLPRGRMWSSYRAAFGYALRLAWCAAKERARQARANAALSALEEIEAAAVPGNVAARIDALRTFAETMPFTSSGREQRRALLAEADDIAQAARCMMIPALDPACHAL